MQHNKDLRYSEAIEQVMLRNGYFAALKLIYKEIWKYKDKSKVIGKTPHMTVQERVQRDKRFTRIGLGVYALTEYLDKLPKITPPETESGKKEHLHAKIQGMLIEIGNNRNEVENTYTNDKKFIFDNKTLGSLTTLSKVHPFTYEHVINETVRFFDVIWFNQRGYPFKIFEVEHSTDFRNSFIKFMELQDFRTIFCCVSFEERRDKFQREIRKTAFEPLKDRCEFVLYEQVENDYKLALTETYL
ncbi:MAG TPA: hypothetical protein HPP66_02245 [Planctomycetes bacterium]|nr:hypothetical protein [Planctomycetota bacterium]